MISASKFQKIAKENFNNEVDVEWCGEKVHIRETIDFKSMMTFINDIVGTVFLDSGDFVPEAIDGIVRICAIRYYSNINLPDDFLEQYRLVYETDAFDVVYEHVNKAQFDEIVRSANRKIQYICETKVFAFTETMEKLIDSFENISEKMTDLFDGIDNIDMKNVSEAIENGVIDEDVIVGAYINQLQKKRMGVYDGEVNEVVTG